MSEFTRHPAIPHPNGWEGIFPIVSVPFTSTGEVDYPSFIETIHYLESTRCSGMVLFGIASEFYKLSDAERAKLGKIFLATKTHKKRMISITEHATNLAVQAATKYQALGVDGLMLLPPFFLNPGKGEVMRHIRAVLESVSVPVCLQIASGETGTTYSNKELVDLQVDFPNVFFKIEGNPAPTEMIKSLINAGRNITVFNGYAGMYMPEMLEIGCRGIMPGCSFVEVYLHLYDLYRSGKMGEMKKIYHTLYGYLKKWMSSCEYIIQIEKNLLRKKGVIQTDYCRNPSYELGRDDYQDVESFSQIFLTPPFFQPYHNQ